MSHRLVVARASPVLWAVGSGVIRTLLTWVVVAGVARLFFAAGDLLPNESPIAVAYGFVVLLYLATVTVVIALALPGPRVALLMGNGLAAGLALAMVNATRPADISDETRLKWFLLTWMIAALPMSTAASAGFLARRLVRRQPPIPPQSRG